jgi:hypothetical protein
MVKKESREKEQKESPEGLSQIKATAGKESVHFVTFLREDNSALNHYRTSSGHK